MRINCDLDHIVDMESLTLLSSLVSKPAPPLSPPGELDKYLVPVFNAIKEIATISSQAAIYILKNTALFVQTFGDWTNNKSVEFTPDMFIGSAAFVAVGLLVAPKIIRKLIHSVPAGQSDISSPLADASDGRYHETEWSDSVIVLKGDEGWVEHAHQYGLHPHPHSAPVTIKEKRGLFGISSEEHYPVSESEIDYVIGQLQQHYHGKIKVEKKRMTRNERHTLKERERAERWMR